MIAASVALVLALAAGAARGRPPADAPQANSARARRGLLPRKVVRARPAPRGRRVVLLPPAPTWLGEPTGAADPVVVLAEARGADPGSEGARLTAMASAEAPDEVPATASWASAEGAEVAAVIRLRSAARDPAPVRAGLSGAEVEALIRRTR